VTVRPIAICVIRRGDEILVFEARDEARDLTFYRPLGGGIEFGERSDDAVRREFQEEIGTELDELRMLTVIENRFEFEGKACHEIVFVYEATLADPDLYDRQTFVVTEETGTLLGVWRRVTDFDMTSTPLYPEGLLEVLTDHSDASVDMHGGRLMASSAAVVHEGKILLVRRRDLGTWEMPGGFVEPGEAPWETAVRECLEESRVKVESGPLVGMYHRPTRDLTIFVFRCSFVGGEPGPTEESLEAAWVDADSLPDPIVEVVRERLVDVIGSKEGVYRTQRGRGNSDLRALP
jgi:ADP-ribose pyrophosphatase YjhB (NUDIX family)